MICRRILIHGEVFNLGKSWSSWLSLRCELGLGFLFKERETLEVQWAGKGLSNRGAHCSLRKFFSRKCVGFYSKGYLKNGGWGYGY